MTISDKLIKPVLLLAFICFGSTHLSAQAIPENYAFETADDYRRYESNVIENLKWILHSPRTGSAAEQRRSAEDYLVKWIYGCPYVRVVLEPYVMELSRKNADLLVTYLFAHTLYKLEHLQDKGALAANIAGISALLDDYNRNKTKFKPDPLLEELGDIQKQGKLSEWIQAKLKNN